MIYFVRGVLSNKVKIGRTRICPVAYVRWYIQARCGEDVELLGVMDGHNDVEIQHLFEPSWSHGEWFNYTEDLKAYIARNTKGHQCETCPDDLKVKASWHKVAWNKGKSRANIEYVRNKPRPGAGAPSEYVNGKRIERNEDA